MLIDFFLHLKSQKLPVSTKEFLSLLEALQKGGYLHDLGKVGIPDAILLKPGRLTEAETEIMHQHTVIGDRLCGELRSLRRVRPRQRLRRHEQEVQARSLLRADVRVAHAMLYRRSSDLRHGTKDLRALQIELADRGLSSLGRCESAARASISAAISPAGPAPITTTCCIAASSWVR